jgi:orotidine 5'-phosphate decarboxylase subfamily 1
VGDEPAALAPQLLLNFGFEAQPAEICKRHGPAQLVCDEATQAGVAALEIGCDGVISSGLEAEALREALGDRLLIVCPGIRPVKNVDDQKRTVDVEEAFNNGADYIVVGRPIRQAADPRAAAQAIQAVIAKAFPATAAGA